MTANGAVYALLVGIDAYPPPVPWLAGCRNDVTDLSTFLEGRLGDRLRLVTLLDREATRQAIVDAMRKHLGQAGAGDVALFSYSGHGSEEPVPKVFATLEPTGRIQTIVCVTDAKRYGWTPSPLSVHASCSSATPRGSPVEKRRSAW